MPEVTEVTDADGNVIGRNVAPTADELAADEAEKAARRAENEKLTTKERLARIEDALGI